MRRWLIAAPLLLLLSGSSTSVANAGRIPIVWGHGPKITDLGELPEDARADVARDLGKPVSVGYMYDHVHVYYLDLWTWGGKHVLHHDDDYWELTDADWNGLLGTSVESKYGKPIFYYCPVGLTLLVIAIGAGFGYSLAYPSKEKQLAKLSKDARYKAAIRTVFPESTPALSTAIDPQRLEAAVMQLMGQGVSESKARHNMQLLADNECVWRELKINQAFDTANHLPAIGETAESIKVLDQLMADLPPSDPRREEAAQLLAARQAELTQAAEPESG